MFMVIRCYQNTRNYSRPKGKNNHIELRNRKNKVNKSLYILTTY